MASALEEQICRIFERELRLTSVSEHDNFFDLGGDSLMAENLALALQSEFKVPLQTSVLLSASSASELAQLITKLQDGPKLKKIVTQLGSNPHNISATMVHGMSGSPLFVSRLGPKFKSMANILAIRGWGINKGEIPLVDPNKIIENYLNAVSSEDGASIEVFGGICIGGLIAFEMGRQYFERTGRKPRLILIDPPLLSKGWVSPFLDPDDAKARTDLFNKKYNKYKKLLKAAELLKLDKTSVGKKIRRDKFKKSLARAFLAFELKPYPCDILFLASSERHQSVEEYTKNLPKDSTVRSVVVEGKHLGWQHANRQLIDDEIAQFLTV